MPTAANNLKLPPVNAEPVVDATIVPEKDPRHARFEEIKKIPDSDPQKYISLEAMIAEFIAAGHNPRSPDDIMFQILGVTPEFLEGYLFSLRDKNRRIVSLKARRKPMPQQAEAGNENEAPAPQQEPAPTAETS